MAAATMKKPNIVFILCDNVGCGDFGVYGGGTPTPRIDQLADEGIRFNNYTVEVQCTPWMVGVALKFVVDYQKSIAQYPSIKTGSEFEGYEATAWAWAALS